MQVMTSALADAVWALWAGSYRLNMNRKIGVFVSQALHENLDNKGFEESKEYGLCIYL